MTNKKITHSKLSIPPILRYGAIKIAGYGKYTTTSV